MKKIVMVVTAITGLFVSAFASDWPAFRGDQQRSGYNADSVISTDNLTASWNTKISGSFINTSQPIVDNGYVYIGTGEGNIYKISISDGVISSSVFTTNGGIVSTGLIKAGILYIGSLDGNMYAINTATMSLVWRAKATAGISASPLYIQDTTSDKIVFIDNSGSIFRVNAADGTGIETLDSNDYISSSPAVNDKIVISGSSGKVYIVEKDISALNAFFLDASSVTNPVIKNNTQFYTGDLSGKVNLMDTGGNIVSSLSTGNQIISPGSFDGNIFSLSDVNEGSNNSGILRWPHLSRQLFSKFKVAFP
jgi:outer membrane protein assembly factor BamB